MDGHEWWDETVHMQIFCTTEKGGLKNYVTVFLLTHAESQIWVVIIIFFYQ